MKVKILNGMVMAISALSLVGLSLPANAQQQKEEEQKQQQRGQQEQKQDQRQQKKQQEQKQQQKQSVQGQKQQEQKQVQKQQPQQERVQQQKQVNQSSKQGQRVQQAEQRGVWQQRRASSWQTEHRTWQQRGGYIGYRIPENRYNGYFGPSHVFRIYSYPMVVVGGYPRFQYNGFWFSVVDPWPEYWSDGWYENDDVYIDYSEDGYYMYNRRYPRDRIAVTVYLN
jgi:flagellar motor protein MotB